MPNACAIGTPAERRYIDAFHRAEAVMLETLVAAFKEAEATAKAAFIDSGLEGAPPAYEYFVASAHQKLYCMLCHADPGTFAGGDPKIALAVIRNGQNIAKRYWGADI